MDTIIEINRHGVFTIDEARELLPVIFRITKASAVKVDEMIVRLDGLNGTIGNDQLIAQLEEQVNILIQEWQTKIQKLGVMPKGLWIADFDSGDGYYCWKYPERSIDFWHRYDDGFSKRISVAERTRPISLQERLKKRLFRPIPLPLQPL